MTETLPFFLSQFSVCSQLHYAAWGEALFSQVFQIPGKHVGRVSLERLCWSLRPLEKCRHGGECSLPPQCGVTPSRSFALLALFAFGWNGITERKELQLSIFSQSGFEAAGCEDQVLQRRGKVTPTWVCVLVWNISTCVLRLDLLENSWNSRHVWFFYSHISCDVKAGGEEFSFYASPHFHISSFIFVYAHIHCHQLFACNSICSWCLCILFSPLERPQFCGNSFFCCHGSKLALHPFRSSRPFIFLS